MLRPQNEIPCAVGMMEFEVSHSLFTIVFFPPHPPLVYNNQYKALLATEDYHVAITTNTRCNRIGRRLEGNIGKCAGGRSVTTRGRPGDGHGTSFGSLSIHRGTGTVIPMLSRLSSTP
jgi:hypothetical protein